MFKVLVAFFLVFGAIIWGQRYAGTWITQHAAELPQREVLPTSPPLPSVDLSNMRPPFNPQISPMDHIPATRHN